MVCQNCKTEQTTDDIYCYNCGSIIKAEETTKSIGEKKLPNTFVAVVIISFIALIVYFAI